MKITSIEQFKTAVPHIPEIQKSRPTDYSRRPITILKVHTDEGIYGLAEGGRGETFEDVEQEWVGVDPMGLNLTTTSGAMVMAMYDIVGKALGVPAYRLMGTKHWDKVPVGYWSPPLEPHEFAAAAENGARQGFKTHKLKARPWNIVETVELMTKAAGPDLGSLSIPISPSAIWRRVCESQKSSRNTTSRPSRIPFAIYRDFSSIAIFAVTAGSRWRPISTTARRS